MKIILKAYNMLNSTKTWQEDFDEAFGVYWSNYKNTLYRCNPNDILDRPSIINSEDIKQFISDLITQTREETIRDIQGKEIEIQNILEPYFVVLDGRDNEPAQETIIEISKKILELLNKLKK